MSNQRLGTYLVNQGVLSEEQLSFCLKIQKSNGGARLGQVLKHYNFVKELDITRALARQVGWELYLGEYVLDRQLADELGWLWMAERGVFPLKNMGKVCVVLARTDDTDTTDIIQAKVNGAVTFYLGLEESVRQSLRAHQSQFVKEEKLAHECKDQLLIWFEQLIQRALLSNASDIHIESSAKAVEIRFRIDGILSFVDSLKLSQLPRLVNIIFNKAEVTVSDFHHFHDARFTENCLNRELDIRVSHIPSVHGSALVLRLLDKHKTAMSLSDLGYGKKHWELIESNLMRPDGVSLIVGPTGCGKTTSLYAMLNFLKSIDKKIVTIEDPVEVRLSLITQLQIQEARGVSFGESVRAFLRHDPDIMLIGEIRDQETAQEAMRAAMTGHKVFATLHTTRAMDALFRLNDLGVQAHYIAHCLTMIMAQRLVRTLCPHCKKSRLLQKEAQKPYLRKYFTTDEQEIFEPYGCEHCTKGFSGRRVVAEIINIDDRFKSMVIKSQWDLLHEYLESADGYISFGEDGRRLIRQGVTSLDEIMRVLG